MKFKTSAALAIAAIAGFSTQVLAATIVMVEETGEGGGRMAIKMDKTELSAGPVVFKVMNGAVTEDHEMILVKLNGADQKIPLNTATHRVDEKKLKTLGEVADIKPNATGELKADLTAGSYLLLCNIKGHYEAGMWQKFIVAGKAASN